MDYTNIIIKMDIYVKYVYMLMIKRMVDIYYIMKMEK
jgi:hypothetical protein